MNGGGLFHLLVLLFGWRWLFCSAAFIRVVQCSSARSLWPLSCSELCTNSSFSPAAGPSLLGQTGSYLSHQLSLLTYGSQSKKITSTVLKQLTCQQEFIDHAHKLIFIQKLTFFAVNSIFFRAARLLDLQATNIFCNAEKKYFLDT